MLVCHLKISSANRGTCDQGKFGDISGTTTRKCGAGERRGGREGREGVAKGAMLARNGTGRNSVKKGGFEGMDLW